MSKGLKVTIIILVLIVLGGIGGYFYLKNDANKKAKEFYDEIKIYKTNVTELKTGVYLDFSKDKNLVTKAKITEGIVFVDEDQDVKFYSNIKINGFYCVNNEGIMNCDLLNKKDTNIAYEINNKEYKVGDAVTLSDGSKWHVINDTSKYSKFVELMPDNRVDVNGDGFYVDQGVLTDPDRIPFDKNGSKVYDVTKEGNIGYYLENTYRSKISNLGNVVEIRLPEFEELEKIKEVIGFEKLTENQKLALMEAEEEAIAVWENKQSGYDIIGAPTELSSDHQSKLMPHWLFNGNTGNFWVIYEYNKISTAVWDGDGYTSKKPTTGASLKPIITIEKSSVLN